MEITAVLWLFFWLFTKHLIVDFPLQTPFQWMNKGTYGHPGGNLHAGLHGISTVAIFAFFIDYGLAFWLGVIDYAIHYHIDWAKMNINKAKGWGANTHAEFWILLGLDQYAHYLTYLLLVIIAINFG